MRRALLAVAAMSLLVPAGAAHARTASVTISEFSFRPAGVRIDPGDTVTWSNRGQVLHNVTSRRGVPQGFRSADLDSGQAFSRVFARAGTYEYLCSLHPDDMRGLVQVGPDRVKPKVSWFEARSGRRTVLSYRLTERSRVVVKLTRRGRTVRTLRLKGRIEGFVTQVIRRPAAGRYRLVLTATDAAGNKTVARTTLRVR